MEEYKVVITDVDGVEFDGILITGEDSGSDNLSLMLRSERCSVSRDAEDYFSALCQIREELEKDGMIIVCNGGSKDVYPSPMMRDMGDGDQAYRLIIGQPASLSNTVNIFDSDVEKFISCTVKEQEEFYQFWLKSKKVNPS